MHVILPKQPLSTIEIAEGALLADIAVLLQLVALYLPIFDTPTRFLIPIVFAVLVLRRRFYAASMSCAVACFVVGLLSGPAALIPLSFSCGAGLFLGLTMKLRMPNILLVLLGATGGTVVLLVLIIAFVLLAGFSVDIIVRQTTRSFELALAFGEWVAGWFGAAGWWRANAVPAFAPLAELMRVYWWAIYPALIWLTLLPVVILMYFSTNVAVRILGYSVRPFPGGRAERALAWLGRRIRRRA